jgi:hypothetical protein
VGARRPGAVRRRGGEVRGRAGAGAWWRRSERERSMRAWSG